MRLTPVNAPDAPLPGPSYSQGLAVDGAARLLFISGQIPMRDEGDLAADFADQCRATWRNVEAQLAASGMGLTNLVKVTTFLADRRDRDENRAIRHEVLGNHAPALTVIVTGLYEAEWKVEIEAVAAA